MTFAPNMLMTGWPGSPASMGTVEVHSTYWGLGADAGGKLGGFSTLGAPPPLPSPPQLAMTTENKVISSR